MISADFSPHVEISLDNLLHNVEQIRTLLSPDKKILAVVKDNSYGCGSIQIAKALEHHGNVDSFAVARPDEAFALRENGIRGSILVLGRASLAQVEKGTLQNITFTLNDLDDFEIWTQCKNHIHFHCNIDTAMHRLGLLPPEIPELIKEIKKNNKFHLDGAFTHLANADEPDSPTVESQRSTFFKCIDLLRSAGCTNLEIHYGNSAGLMCFPLTDYSMVRPGIALYGCQPEPNRKFCLNLKPILSLKSSVVKIKKVPAGTPVSYGGHYITPQETYIATIAIGYGNGLPRALSNKGYVLIGGKRYRIAGNITMDYLMVDAGPNPEIKIGDEVVVIGTQGNEQITPDEIARMISTISYEILCNISNSIDRYYLFNDSIVLNKSGDIY